VSTDRQGEAVPRPEHLVATTVALPPGARLDPMALAGEEGVLFAGRGLVLAGRGEAARLELPGGLADAQAVADATAWLAAVPVVGPTDHPGTGVVAHGALPFDRHEPASLLVPAVTYGADDQGREWVTVVGPPPPDRNARRWRARLQALTADAADRGDPGRPTVTPVPAPGDYTSAVANAVAAIALGQITKVVLGRSVVLEFPGAPDVAVTTRRLQVEEPACTVFTHPVPGGVFLGASPELLVSRRGPAVSSHPMAGTTDLDGGRADALLASPKNRWEHQLVVDEIARVLTEQGVTVDLPTGPDLMRLHSVAHLVTRIEGQAGAGTVPPSVLTLLAALHPTPAVGGVPRDQALEVIELLETAPRGRWAGPVGWVDGRGDGDWVIGIRSATVTGRRAVLWAGAGIVADSVPEAELLETTIKLVPVLQALYPGGAALLSR
jgi:menaquinone-specific isochorismate synthase